MKTAREIAKRAGYMCAFPRCGRLTVGPTDSNRGSVITGEAAHIHAASPGGPRYDSEQTAKERESLENGIWLCADHATLIDKDPDGYSADSLKQWKIQHEARIRQNLGKTLRQKIVEISGEHIATGTGEVTALVIEEAAIIRPGTKSIAMGQGVITGTRIGGVKDRVNTERRLKS